jgi:sugar/nucleoside kinase (ribokinase family)
VAPTVPAKRRGAPQLAVVGHVNIDRFLLAHELPRRDRTVPIHRQEVRLGGTAGNIARAAAREGVQVGLVGAVGDDFPEAFRAMLRSEGIDLAGLQTVSGVPSPACFIVEDGRGGQSTLIDQGPFADERHYRFDPRHVRAATFAHLTTGPPDSLLKLAEAVRGGPRLAADPAQEIHYRWDRPRLRRLLEASEILFGNRAELARAVKLLDVGSVRSLLDTVPLVVGTLGPGGAFAWSRRGRETVPGLRPEALRQVTGAGDAFRGGFWSGWIAGRPVRDCLIQGVRTATGWIEGTGSLADGPSLPAARSAP